MGRWGFLSKTEADGLNQISVSFLNKHKYFIGFHGGTITWTHSYSGHKSSVGIDVSTMTDNLYLRIHYTQTDRDTAEKKDFDYKIPLLTTKCNFGGKRYWFQCPWFKGGVYCGRRVGVLYKDGDYFACRHCNELTYASRHEGSRFRLFPFRYLALDQKIEDLEKHIKRRHYQGRPTKKQRQLMALYQQAERSYEVYSRLGKDKMV